MIVSDGKVEPRAGEASAPVVNYFNTPTAALRYATHRPRGQARVLELMQNTVGAELPVARALDIGCGTGHSTIALLPYAQKIFGIDPSSVMLAQAPRDARIEYRKGYAEALPVRDRDFDLVTVSSAYHWFDHERFLREAARVLRPRGWLVLYKFGSTGCATGQPDFERWRGEVLNARYPKVSRNSEPLSPERAAQFGFAEIAGEATNRQQRHTLEDYVENLLTHSSVLRVVEGGQEPVSVARAWLRDELAPFFAAGDAAFTHDVRLHVLRRDCGSS